MSDYDEDVKKWADRKTYDKNTNREKQSKGGGRCVVGISGAILGLLFVSTSCETTSSSAAGRGYSSSYPTSSSAQETKNWKVDADGTEWGRNTSGEWVKDTRSMTEKMFGMSVLTEDEKLRKSQAYEKFDDAVSGFRGPDSSTKSASAHCDFCGGDGRVPADTYLQSGLLTPSSGMGTTWCRTCR